MAYTDTWDAAFEALPADSENISQGADRIRDLKLAVRERMEHDHYWDEAGTDADHGEHLTIALREQASVGSPGTAKAFLYGKTVSGKPELVYKDEDDNEVQITSEGSLTVSGIPATTKMLFYADAAPTGWTLDNTLDDKLVFVTKGSAAGGETGGGAHASGTWTQLNHTHTVDIWANDKTGSILEEASTSRDRFRSPGLDEDWVSKAVATRASVGKRETTANGAPANTWRPAAYCFIICSKD